MQNNTIDISSNCCLPDECRCGYKLYGPASVHMLNHREGWEYKECPRCLIFYVRELQDE